MNWQQLTILMNASPGNQLLQIGFQMEDVGSRIIYYERASIQKATFHENLFSLRLGWQALLCPFANTWHWITPPTQDGQSVQIIDYDVSGKQPIEEGLVLKGLFKIVHYSFSGILALEELDPSSLLKENRVVHKSESCAAPNHLETGKWIIPGNCKAFLLDPSLIRHASH